MDIAILRFLRGEAYGKENAYTSEEICRMFNINEPMLRRIVHEWRAKGYPICSDIIGYYYAKTQEELERTIKQLTSRAKKISEAVDGLMLTYSLWNIGEGVKQVTQ